MGILAPGSANSNLNGIIITVPPLLSWISQPCASDLLVLAAETANRSRPIYTPSFWFVFSLTVWCLFYIPLHISSFEAVMLLISVLARQ